MQYMGGKARIATSIAQVIVENRNGRNVYLEPFVGGASVFSKVAPLFQEAIAGDVIPDLILFWTAVQQGWRPPEHLTREEYEELRNASPSALRAFAGFGCSFGSRWFQGYGVQRPGAHQPNGHVSVGAARSTAKKAAGLAGARFVVADYRQWNPGPDHVVYCDPPYSGTRPYVGAPEWDAEEFWSVARDWSRRGAVVLVSEYQAPAGWISVWSARKRMTLNGATNVAVRTENVFAYQPERPTGVTE